MVKRASARPVAYSYVRFSTPEQKKGDSTDRQTHLREAWLKKSGAVLDTSLRMTDEGVSAFSGAHRTNADRNALAAFLELVQQGRIARGSYLIVESLDRLTREHIRPALTLLLNLIDQGIRVVQLLPVETVYDEKVEPMTLMMAIMELGRGHSESRMKSERSGSAWRALKNRARAGELVTTMVPAWIHVDGVGRRCELDERAAEAIRLIYRLARDGHGVGVITKKLNADKVPPIGRGDRWPRSYVAFLLRTRLVLGEYQPRTGRTRSSWKPDGPPVPNYFPAVVTEEEWFAVRAALSSRRWKGGPIGKRVHLFSGLLRDARDGGSVHVTNKGHRSAGPVLASAKAADGAKGAKFVSFPLGVFEEAVLRELREIDPREVVPRDDRRAERLMTLAGRESHLRSRIDEVKAAITGNEKLAPLVEALRTLTAELEQVEEELDAARREEASPLSEAWGSCRSLVDALAKAPDPAAARTRLRAALRRITTEVRCLFVGHRQTRIAAVQLWFAGGGHRSYLILSQPKQVHGSHMKPARWWVRSFADAGGKADGLDLRNRKDAAALEKVLVKAAAALTAEPDDDGLAAAGLPTSAPAAG